jgi:hypothetical protein
MKSFWTIGSRVTGGRDPHMSEDRTPGEYHRKGSHEQKFKGGVSRELGA